MNKRGKDKTEPRYLRIGAVVFLLILIFFGIAVASSSCRAGTTDNAEEQTTARTSASAEKEAEEAETITEKYTETAGETAASIVVYPRKTNKTKELSKDYDAKNAFLFSLTCFFIRSSW